MKGIEYKDTGLDSVLDVDIEKRTVKSVWNTVDEKDLDEDIIIPNAYTKTIAERGPIAKKLIWSLTDHRADMKYAIGKPEELYIEGNRLIAITKIQDTTHGNDMATFYNDGIINQHSIGFSTIQSEYNTDTNIRVIKELQLYEGSAVMWAANENTPTLGMKGLTFDESKTHLSGQLELLLKCFRSGTYSDDGFVLLELQIKQLQSKILALTTPPVVETVEPVYDELLKALKSTNDRLTRKVA